MPAAFFGSKLDARHVTPAEPACRLHLEGDLFEVLGVAQIAAAAHDILGLGHLDHAAATSRLLARIALVELSEA